jgi:hypothetical protein
MTKPGDPPAAGSGPQSVPTAAATYYAIAIEDQRRALAEASMGRWAAEAKEPLPPGEVPHLPTSSPWAHPDGFGTEAPLGEAVDGSDPSGVSKNRGIG